MYFLNSNVVNYNLHECIVDSIEVKQGNFSLIFNNGILYKNKEKNNYISNDKCVFNCKINDLVEGEEYRHISITKIKNRKKIEISINKFSQLLNTGKFRIYLDFYSDFAKAIMLIGHIHKCEIELLITDIDVIELKTK